MREFDYKRAWEELAKPAFDALPQNVRDLYERVCVEMQGARQNRSLGLDWPDTATVADHLYREPLNPGLDTCAHRGIIGVMCGRPWLQHPAPGSLRAHFMGIESEVLFDAQATVYWYGHWSSAGHSYKGAGGTWKFQIL